MKRNDWKRFVAAGVILAYLITNPGLLIPASDLQGYRAEAFPEVYQDAERDSESALVGSGLSERETESALIGSESSEHDSESTLAGSDYADTDPDSEKLESDSDSNISENGTTWNQSADNESAESIPENGTIWNQSEENESTENIPENETTRNQSEENESAESVSENQATESEASNGEMEKDGEAREDSLSSVSSLTVLDNSTCEVAITPSSCTYDGNEQKPTVTVKLGTETLAFGEDYVLTYSDNIDAGAAIVTVKGTGKYTGSVTKAFVIAKANSGLAFAESKITKKEGDAAFVNILSKKTDAAVTFTSGDTKVAEIADDNGKVKICGRGKTVITATAEETANYEAGKAEYALTVKDGRIDISNNVSGSAAPKVSVSGVSISYGYTGKAYMPKLTLKVDGETLVSDVDYMVKYSNNVKPGTATITITGQGKYKGTRVKNFQIVSCASRLVSGNIYQLIPKNNPDTAVCPQCGKTEKNTKVYITNRSDSKAMQYKAVMNDDGTWKFVNVKSGRVLAVQQNSAKTGAGIVLYDSTQREAQNWKATRKSDNAFAITNAVTGYGVALADASAGRGTILRMEKASGGGHMRFYFVEVAGANSETGSKSSAGGALKTDGVVEPTLKLYGMMGKIGSMQLQSMVNTGNYLYLYAGASGRFCRVNKKTHASTWYTMRAGKEINKGNGMAADGVNLYLSGNDNKIYVVPISSFKNSDTITFSKAVDVGIFMNGLCYDYSGKTLYGYHRDAIADKLIFYKIYLSASKDRAKKAFEVSWSEASRYYQDMELFDNAFYIVSDYPGTMVKISKDGKLMKNYRLSQYTDNGVYTGEFEGICRFDDRLLLASAHTGFWSGDADFPAIGKKNPEDGVTLRQSRTIVLTQMDPVKDLTSHDPYMRGAVAMQKAVVHIDYSKNTWKPDGTSDNPFPSPVTAQNARKNPRYEYVFKVVKPEVDENNKPFMIIANQKDVTIDLSKACSNANGAMSLYICNSRITLSSAAKFRISYMADSEVNYVSDPALCLGVMDYGRGNGTSRFNSSSQMKTAFGKAGSTPNGNYTYRRQFGSASDSPIVLERDQSVRLPAGKSFQITVNPDKNGDAYSGGGVGERATTRLPLVNSSGDIAMVEFRYDAKEDMVYLYRFRKATSANDEGSIQYAVLSVNMA
ncbi:MAG: RICIN domain-containing protein [Lachnospiraceae bacterium]|nr:RICIN domain-containing protein [Lachnospiraceae bacterium]